MRINKFIDKNIAITGDIDDPRGQRARDERLNCFRGRIGLCIDIDNNEIKKIKECINMLNI